MGSSAEELVLRITGDSAGGQDAIKGLEDRVKEATTAFGKAALEGMGPMGEAAGIAALAAAALGTALMELGQHATEVAAELEKVSLTTGIAVPALADLKFAVEATGGSLDQLNNVMFMFEQRMVNSSAKVETGLQMIGLSLQQIGSMSDDQKLLAISDAMRASGDETNKAAVAMDIFGRQGRTILPELMGPMSELAAKSKELGGITAEAAEKAHEFEIAQKTMAAEGARAWVELGLAVAPVTNDITLAWDRMKLAVANVALTAMDGVTGVARFGDELEALMPDADTSREALERLGGALPKVADSLKGLADGTGMAAAGLKKWTDAVNEYTGHQVTLDEALDNEKESIRDLDSVTQKHIEDLAKHKQAVDALVSSLEGESKKSGEMVEAVQQVIDTHTQDADVIQRVVDQIDKLYDRGVKISDEMLIWADANRVVKGSLDNLGMFLSQVGALVPENSAHLAEMSARFDDVRSAIQGTWMEMDLLAGKTDTQEELDARWKKSLDEVNAALNKVTDSEGLLGTALEDTLTKIPSIIERGLTGAGGISGAVKAIGSHLGTDLGKGIQETLWEQMGTSDTGDNALTSAFGDNIGGALTAAMPAIGALIGPLISKLFSLGGPSADELAGRKVEATFEQSFGSFDQMMAAVGKAYDQQGKSAQQAQTDVLAMLAAEKQGGDAAAAAVAKINSVLQDQQQDAADLQTAIQKYGFSIDQLGPTMQKQQLDDQAKTLINDWRLLVGSGMDVVTVDQKMASSTWDYIQMAKRTGQEVPQAMEPVLQSMLDQGVFTDETGAKLTDLSQLGVTFSKTTTQGFQSIVDKLDELIKKIGDVPAALGNIKPIPAPWANWPPIPDLPGDGGDQTPIPMAKGWQGRVTRPTLFLAGEAGAEDVAFSGGGKSFRGAGGGIVVNVTVEGNVSTERDLADAISGHLQDQLRMTTQFNLRGQ